MGQKPFLADQATHLGSFRWGTEDLLSLVLPLVIRCNAWNRFLRFTLVAYSTASLAVSLGSRTISGQALHTLAIQSKS